MKLKNLNLYLYKFAFQISGFMRQIDNCLKDYLIISNVFALNYCINLIYLHRCRQLNLKDTDFALAMCNSTCVGSKQLKSSVA